MTKDKLIKLLYFNLDKLKLKLNLYFDSLPQSYILKLTKSFFFVNRVGVN